MHCLIGLRVYTTNDCSEPLNVFLFALNIQIIGPDQKIIYTGEKESSGKYAFAAYTDGMYKYCFSNRVSTMERKLLKFNMEIGDPPKDQLKKNEGTLTC